MNYPVWYIPSVGGALVMAIVAIVHVVISHFAVGGGLWLVLTEKKAYREKKEFILEYVKKHTKFFILLTMVMGSMTGVGIWITISLISPGGTSLLIHTFVFAWGIEWVFFLIEIVTAFLYFYTFDKISRKTHLLIGWIYFIAAWASLVMINAIISFMLTPGNWIETGDFWDGILNPSALPSTLFRTFLSFALAGSYALLTAARKFKGEQKATLVRYNGKWIGYSILGMIPSMVWYYLSLPQLAKSGLAGDSTILQQSLIWMVGGLGVFVLLLLIFTLWKPQKMTFGVSIGVLLSVFVFFGGFEFIREAGRKPFVIRDFLYSNDISVHQYQEMKDSSILEKAKWVQRQEVTETNHLEAGEEVFRIQCAACHTFGIKNNFSGKLKFWKKSRIINLIGNLRGRTKFMPPFLGNTQEKEALGEWIYAVTHKDQEQAGAPDLERQSLEHQEENQAGQKPVTISGEAVFEDFCSDCHEATGEDGIAVKIKSYRNLEGLLDMLGRLEELNEDMPPFEGSPEEKKALANYLKSLNPDKHNTEEGKEDE
jgi:cytochrome bd-type quinol oxidase subunit 1/mono/diheme cytochrome c family protein